MTKVYLQKNIESSEHSTMKQSVEEEKSSEFLPHSSDKKKKVKKVKIVEEGDIADEYSTNEQEDEVKVIVEDANQEETVETKASVRTHEIETKENDGHIVQARWRSYKDISEEQEEEQDKTEMSEAEWGSETVLRTLSEVAPVTVRDVNHGENEKAFEALMSQDNVLFQESREEEEGGEQIVTEIVKIRESEEVNEKVVDEEEDNEEEAFQSLGDIDRLISKYQCKLRDKEAAMQSTVRGLKKSEAAESEDEAEREASEPGSKHSGSARSSAYFPTPVMVIEVKRPRSAKSVVFSDPHMKSSSRSSSRVSSAPQRPPSSQFSTSSVAVIVDLKSTQSSLSVSSSRIQSPVKTALSSANNSRPHSALAQSRIDSARIEPDNSAYTPRTPYSPPQPPLINHGTLPRLYAQSNVSEATL
jgi:hypothetical protein